MKRIFTQDIKHKEIKDAFDTVGIIIRAKINRLCNERKYEETEKLEKALCLINDTDYNV